MGLIGLRARTSREPSGERSHKSRWSPPKPVSSPIGKRASSEPRPFTGSKAVMVISFRSLVVSATTHNLDGDLAQRVDAPSRTEKIVSGVPPVMGTLTTDTRVFKRTGSGLGGN